MHREMMNSIFMFMQFFVVAELLCFSCSYCLLQSNKLKRECRNIDTIVAVVKILVKTIWYYAWRHQDVFGSVSFKSESCHKWMWLKSLVIALNWTFPSTTSNTCISGCTGIVYLWHLYWLKSFHTSNTTSDRV